jgi:glycine hydroxymethyltransferase
VQPLSGAAANLAVYDAFCQTGDTVMGMDLFQGGHLTHGSEFNFSGKRFRVASYGVSKATGKLDYDEIRDLARASRPKMIIAGFTSYTWAPDWQLFAEIAHEVGALLLADISHPAGMATAGAYPNPDRHADVITCTTHKTLCGPRGAIIMTTDEDLAHSDRHGRLPRRAGRAAHAEVRGDGRRVQDRGHARIQAPDAPDQGERGGAGGRAHEARA